MAIIIGDIHGDLAMAQAFLAYKPEAEHVALGDFVDSRDPKATFEEELACLELLIASGAVLLWGNHDLTYTPERPWRGLTHHGFINDQEVPRWTDGNKYLARVFEKDGALYCRDSFVSRYHLARQKDQVKAAYAADGWLCTHAGVSTALTAALPSAPWVSGDPSTIASWICEEFEREFATKTRPWHESFTPYGKGPLFYRDWTRGGEDLFGGIFWFDPQWEPSRPPDPRFKQIFGHTKVAGPMRKLNHVNVHIEDGWWVFDTESEGFVRLGP
ncbi:metallophosphoesterase family protein [Oryzomonas rubra]|uniref:Metallophosphatase family protein n=1 Tax=Oryzomonas rubra TaxID=2509454 RepID=A0A5A9XMT8_9BACT|nr:metallophosphoesterase family protein [Oryzomonas rubra]KAA0894244.1 metallophosphatase family protein [Oryzomonas rubra]